MVEKKPDSKELLVFIISKETQCAECKEALDRGRWIILEPKGAICLECADLDHLEFLASGDAAMTRRATKYSNIHAKVLQWSSSRKRYERQGIIIEPEALNRAEIECLSDKDLRLARQDRESKRRGILDQKYVEAFAAQIVRIFPRCPPDSATQIAKHACQKYSGRVGRSAAAKEFEDNAIILAVRAHIRHVHTKYDEYLMSGVERDTSRSMVAKDVDVVVQNWKTVM